LLDRRPFRPGAFFGKVGALEREIGRTRGGLSVRRLVEQYGEVIGAITPCVLVSPDSLARFVPPGSMTFDLVVFDEASQITVADAVGALGRADAAVIAGDSKQMPPSVFAELSMDETDAVEAEFQVVPDEESILTEAVHAGVGPLWLSWHYRSPDESLIAFSNAAYYDNRLSSFPAHPAQSHDTGVSFTRVAGTFLRASRGAEKGALRTNPVEAAAVVAEVLRRWQARERSIGVVTFNIQQRALIESMLEESGVDGLAEALAAKRDGVFVKNLENVQGDERDVILFSTGFSANAEGVLPLNFGPLNRSGG
jgi:superfamily I DNA and/or RNA helicase